MSLLLDALRKSEKRRQADAPPLSLPSGPGPYRREPRRRVTWILVGLVVLAAVLAAAAWLYLGPFASDAGTPVAKTDTTEQQLVVPDYAAPETNRTSGPGGSNRPMPDGNRGPARGPVEAAPTRSDRSADADPNASPRSDLAEQVDSARTRPDLEAPARSDPEPSSRPDSDARSEADIRVQTEAGGESEADADAQVQAESEANVRSDDESGRADELAEFPESPEPTRSGPSATQSTTGQSADRTAGRNSILPWELPTAARGDFPDLDVTLHFYASEPANRFVLIDGERYVEGDRVSAGVVLSEITRDGVVVDYRNYRVRLR